MGVFSGGQRTDMAYLNQSGLTPTATVIETGNAREGFYRPLGTLAMLAPVNPAISHARGLLAIFKRPKGTWPQGLSKRPVRLDERGLASAMV
jgi:hypothetical protein